MAGLYRYLVRSQSGAIMPKITILDKTNLQEDSWHSMLISLLRGLAALVVALAHLRSQMYPGFGTVAKPPALFQGLAFGAGFAYLAVIVFFVLSGWLVGGSFLNKLNSDRAFQNYAIDRASRLWVVLVPTFVVVLIVGGAIGELDTARISFSKSEPYSLSTFLGNLIGIQTIIVPPFGGNFPLWSLANETWYYVLFPLLVLVFRGRMAVTRVAAVLVIGGIVQLVSGPIMLYFSIWLLGAAFSRIKIEVGPILRWALLFLFGGTAVFIRLRGKTDITPEGYAQYLVFSLIFVLFLSSMQFKWRSGRWTDWLDHTSRFFANFSFTLYVLHVPMIVLMGHVLLSTSGVRQLSPYSPFHYLIFTSMYLMLVVGAYLFYLLFESNTPSVRLWLKTQLFGVSAQSALKDNG
jgi:peptidoglycan/LPS O-acetylase OafA/YrhL